MSHSARWFLGVVLAGCSAISANAQQSPGSPSPARSATVVDTLLVPESSRTEVTLPERDRKDVPWRSFSDVTKNARVRNGLFTLYVKRDNTYLSLAPAQLDHDYLLVTQLSQGIGELGVDGGSSVRSDLVRFHRAGDRIELWVVNPHFAAAPGTPMARAVEYSFGHSVAHSFSIATMSDKGEILIDLTPFLLSDWADLAPLFQAVANQRKLSGNVFLDRERSSLQQLQIFAGNLEAEVRLTYQSNRNLGLETLADYRWIPVGVHYSLLELPDTPMRPRYADERVGFFVSAIKDFSRDTSESFFVRFVNRWRLEKRDPAARLSEPVKPIVYYIDRTVPTEWRPWVRAGILEWNKAFEDAGFRNAIQVLDAPDDTLWSAEDARFSTVRWTATNRSVYAVGPSNVDPRTGEILNADVLVSAAWIQTWRGESGEYVAPDAAVRSIFVEDSVASSGTSETRLCSLSEGLRRQGTLARAVLAGAGKSSYAQSARRLYIGQALKALIMREIGHTLGLRHNFRGSAGVTRDQLASKAYTRAHGHGVSVMDYSPPTLALDAQQQGDYYAPTIGTYDRWAIRYGYTPFGSSQSVMTAKGSEAMTPDWVPESEVKALGSIAAEAANPAHLYGTDEDAGFGGLGLDPTVSRYDQTDDPLGWARERVTLINRLFDSLPARMVAPGQGYARLRAAFTDLLSDRWYATLITTKYLGGAVTARDHRGDPAARPAFVTVPASVQRQALEFIAESGFGPQAYRFSPELLNHLGPNRWRHWGSAPGKDGRIDFPLHQWAMSQQRALLNQLLDPMVLARIRDAELRVAEGESTVTIPELFSTLTAAIWAETGVPGTAAKPIAPRNVPSVRRDLQRAHLNSLIQMIVDPLPDTPEDARTLARVTLSDLGAQLDRARRFDLDPYTRAHLLDSRERINQALHAQMFQNAGMTR